MRLIDADALKEKAVHYSETEYHFEHDAVEIDDIDDAPTVEPACTWHRVEEPPKVGQNVLTMDANEDMETAIYDGECFEDSYGFYVTDVLYWMPIEPPKEDA